MPTSLQCLDLNSRPISPRPSLQKTCLKMSLCLKTCLEVSTSRTTLAITRWSKTPFTLVVVSKGIHSRSDTNRYRGRGFILLLPQAVFFLNEMLAVMLLNQHRVLHSKPSDLVLHVVPDVWDTLLEHGLRFVQRHRTRNSVKERDPICAWTNGIAQHQSAVELNPSCSGKAHLNRPGISPGHKNTGPGSIFTVLRVPFVICPFRSANAKSGKVVQKIPCSWHKRASGS